MTLRMGLDKDGGLDPTVQHSPTVKNSTTLLSGIHQIQAVSIGVVASSLQDSSELPPKAPFLDLRARGRVRQRLANRFLRNSALGLVMTLSWLSAISAVLTDVAELWHTYVFAHGVQVKSPKSLSCKFIVQGWYSTLVQVDINVSSFDCLHHLTKKSFYAGDRHLAVV